MPGYADYRQLLDALRPELVTVATRTPERADIIAAAVAAGARALHLEKPLCNSVAQLAHLEALLGLAPPAAVAATAHFRAAASTHGPAFMGQAMGLRTAVTTGTDDDIAALLTTCFGLDATSLPAAIAALRTRYPSP